MKRTLEERFFAKVDKNGPLPDQDNPHYAGLDRCWVWTGYSNGRGYGLLSVASTQTKAHRLSYALHHGPIPAGLSVCHRCDNSMCVNPAHLFAASQRDNLMDCARKRRNANIKLSFDDVRNIRARWKSGETQRALAAEFGVAQANIYYICHRKTYAHVDD